jgi:hypothetical protein
MEQYYQYLMIAAYMIIPIGVLLLIINIIYRKIKGKSMFTSGTTFVGENMISIWETENKKAAVEEIQYQREEKRDEAEPGEPPEAGDKKSK